MKYSNREGESAFNRANRIMTTENLPLETRSYRPFASIAGAFSAIHTPGQGTTGEFSLTEPPENWAKEWTQGGSPSERIARARRRRTADPVLRNHAGSHDDQRPTGFLYLFAVSGPTKVLNGLIRDNCFHLDRATGRKALLGHPGNPQETGTVYESMRDEKLKALDKAETRNYRRFVRLLSREFHESKLAHAIQRRLRVLDVDTPCLVFLTGPSCSSPARLKVRFKWITDAQSQHAFVTVFIEFFESFDFVQLAGECATNREFCQRFEVQINEYFEARLGTADPVLVLDTVEDGEANPSRVARIWGYGAFNDLNKVLGLREYFLMYLLFHSERTYVKDGRTWTVLIESDGIQELFRWSDHGPLKLEGKDRDNPAHRITKNWGYLIDAVSEVQGLKDRLATFRDDNLGKLYALGFRPDELEIRMHPLLMRKPNI